MSIFDRLKKQPQAAGQADDTGKKAPAQAAKTAKSKKAAKNTPAAAVAAPANGKAVLIRPLVTEKATLTGTYAFLVARTTNKNEVAKAVEAQYGVKPKHVRMMNMYGKKVRWNYQQGKRSDWKKAIVRLPEGQTINVYEAE